MSDAVKSTSFGLRLKTNVGQVIPAEELPGLCKSAVIHVLVLPTSQLTGEMTEVGSEVQRPQQSVTSFDAQVLDASNLHRASTFFHQYKAVRDQEEKRPTTGLVKVICLAFDRKAFNDHEKKKSSATSHESLLGGSSWANTLFVWFPAAWMPLLVEAI